MSDHVNITQILLSGGVGAIVVEGIRALSQRKKMDADYAETISQSAIGLLQPLEKRIAELEEELLECKDELVAAKAEAVKWREEAERERERFTRGRDDDLWKGGGK